jgi:hypothetical protein
MKKVILLFLAALLGGCLVWTDPKTGNVRAQTVFQPMPDPESMVPQHNNSTLK